RAEAFVERGREDGDRNAFVDGGLDGPAAFAGIGDVAFELCEGGVFHEGGRGQVEKPGGDDAAAPPDLCDVADIELVLVVFGIAQGGRLGVDVAHMFADVSTLEDTKAFGVGGHDAVFDAVVDHFDEVARAVGPAMEIALLGGAAKLFAAGSARDVARTGGE